jgi:hypothetical protein
VTLIRTDSIKSWRLCPVPACEEPAPVGLDCPSCGAADVPNRTIFDGAIDVRPAEKRNAVPAPGGRAPLPQHLGLFAGAPPPHSRYWTQRWAVRDEAVGDLGRSWIVRSLDGPPNRMPASQAFGPAKRPPRSRRATDQRKPTKGTR